MSKVKNEMPYQPHPNEVEIVQECLKGNPLYQKKLFEKYYAKMLGTCQRYTNNRDEAQDMLQDGFVKVFQNLENFGFNCPLEAWVRRIMVNTAIDKYRTLSRQPKIFDLDDAHELTIETNILNEINHNELLAIIQKLPLGYKMIFNMHVIEGFSHKEIAEELSISEGTSKTQLMKAKAWLQRVINKEFANRND